MVMGSFCIIMGIVLAAVEEVDDTFGSGMANLGYGIWLGILVSCQHTVFSYYDNNLIIFVSYYLDVLCHAAI